MRCSLRQSIVRVALTSSLLSAAMAADVYRCVDTAGNVVFTDVHCKGAVRLTPVGRPRPAAPSGLSQAELDAVTAIDARLEQRSAAVERQRRRARTDAHRRAEARNRACASATAELKTIARQKRQGYRITEARRLDAREQQALETVQVSC